MYVGHPAAQGRKTDKGKCQNKFKELKLKELKRQSHGWDHCLEEGSEMSCKQMSAPAGGVADSTEVKPGLLGTARGGCWDLQVNQTPKAGGAGAQSGRQRGGSGWDGSVLTWVAAGGTRPSSRGTVRSSESRQGGSASHSFRSSLMLLHSAFSSSTSISWSGYC